MNIFFSYPHDDNSEFVKRLKKDLEKRGHTVWFDEAEIKTGDDWRSKITRGILDSETVVAFLSKHAVRDPGVCLNEIAIALAEKGDEAIVTVLLEPEKLVSAPISITHVQWLKMEDHTSLSMDEGWYRTHFDKLVELIENPSSANRHEELGKLKDVLNPLSFNADIASHLTHFSGRQWLVARYEEWLSKPASGSANKVFRIEGGPGMGKTAVASYLAHATKSSVLGVHLCKSGSAITHNPAQLVLSLAYQLATRLPDYRARLLRVPCIKNPDLMKDEDAGSLWDMLISEPLAGAGKSGLIDRQRLSIVIDGLDEATKNGQNSIVDLLVDHIQTLPAWVGVVLTGRPDPELTQSLRQFTPQVINGDDPANMEDLRNYIDAWLADEVKAQRLQAHQVPAAASALLQKSEGAFLYLAQAREEALQNNAGGSASFDLSNPSSLPSGLNALYQKLFRRRFPDVQSDPDNPATRWNALVKPLLGYILASPEPLPLDLARGLLGWDTDTTGNEKQHKALQALGSLMKRNGNPDKPYTCTLAPFHNSVREWLTSESSQQFRLFTEASIYPLSEVTWKRYLNNKEKDAYAWQVLPDLLEELPQDKQDELLGAPNWDTSQVLFRLASSMTPKLRYAEALSTWFAQVCFSKRLSQSAPENAQFAIHQADSYTQLGDSLATLGRTDEALACFEWSLKIAEDLSAQDPENAEFARGLFINFLRLGDMQVSLGRNDEVLDYYQRGLKIAEKLSARAPQNGEFASALSTSFGRLGRALANLGRNDEALDYYQRGLQIAEKLSARAPESIEFKDILSFSCDRLGDTLARLGRTDEALSYHQRSLKIAEDLSAQAPENAEFARGLLHRFNNLGQSLTSAGRTDEALGYYQRSLRIAEDLSAQAPESAQFAYDLTIIFFKLGQLLASVGRTYESLDYFQRGIMIAEVLNARDQENARLARDLSVGFSNLGDTLVSLGRKDEALSYYQRSLKTAEELSAQAPENADFTQNLLLRFHNLGDILASLRREREALGYYQRSLKIAEEMSAQAPENAELARCVFASYWKSADLTTGEEQLMWWRKAYEVLLSMQERGILAKDDEQYVAAVQAKLSLSPLNRFTRFLLNEFRWLR